MRIFDHPKLRRVLAILGLILILGLLAAFLIVLMTGGSRQLAIGLFGCFTMISIVMYIFIGYVRRNS
jgi:hypothetical protein